MTWFKDTAERVLTTFVQAWLGAWIVIEEVTVDKLFDQTILSVGLVAAAGSLIKALAARQVGNPESASLAS